MALLITRPASGSSTIPGASYSGVIVAPTESVTVDTLPASAVPSVKWLITLIDATTGRTLGYEVFALNKFGVDVTHTKYAMIGDTIFHELSVNIYEQNIILHIQNNDTTSFTVHVVRINTTH